MDTARDIVIIGGGPGGYVAALRASQLGKKPLLVEADRVGGVCMNWGCIPTKFLLHQTGLIRALRTNARLSGPLDRVACDWKRVQEDRVKIVDRLVKGTEFLLERNKVDLLKGRAALLDERHVRIVSGGTETDVEARSVILATGSRPADLPFLKADGRRVITSREVLELDPIPESLLVVGAGAIGLELGSVYARLGTKVTVLEILPQILPGSDKEMATRLERLLKIQGVPVFTRMKIERAAETPGGVRLEGVCLKSDEPFSFEAERVLLAAGRRPNSDTFQDGAGLVALDGGFVRVDETMRTSLSGVFAVGDLVGGKLLAHKASHEGLVAAENAAGGNVSWDDRALPMSVFTEPEFASVGLGEEEARERGIKIQVGLFSLQANGRALTVDSPEGCVKLVAGPDDTVLGAHILAPGASDMIPELTLAVRMRLKLRDVSSTIHIHPTISESIVEAALKAKGEALHALNIVRR